MSNSGAALGFWKRITARAARLSARVAFCTFGACTAFCTFGALTAPARAADITVELFHDVNPWEFRFFNSSSFEPRALKARLTGEIVPGDAKKLRDAVVSGLRQLNELTDPDWEPVPGRDLVVVSLDSPGGDFRTGIEIGNTIRALSLPTLVERDATCLSACAVAFMFGYTLQPESYPERVRVLEAGGTLGFHRPVFVDVEGFDLSSFEGQTQAEIDAVISYEYATFYDLANQLIQEMLATDPAAWSNDLLLRMLLAEQKADGANTFVYLDKVGQAIEWGVRVSGLALPRIQCQRDHHREIWSLCYNTVFAELDYLRWQATGDFDAVRRGLQTIYDVEGDAESHNYEVVIEGRNGERCQVSYSKDGLSIEASRTSSTYVDPTDGDNVIFLHKAGTALREIARPAGARRPTPQMLAERLARRDLLQCPVNSTAAQPIARCRLSSGGMMIRSEPCTQLVKQDSITGDVRVTYEWEDGGQTVVVNPSSKTGTIDGSRMERRYPKESRNFKGFCALSFGTGNQFCYIPE